ncbi:kinase [Pasteurella skyensis]|uniref:Kinase n=1 Tax=Phocoenobacter skyensis TaxID=97481 RepID=A0AAJ6N8V3_9PAST|nr:kinase [Pasteurella skyensis]MDP8162308.1 kinase [Pasteurella skyensis]MDP8172358.1 kinase [Pasteurella skyensis]MDP8177009.1 kinase [Pasteurella skyensis]MDP8178613.1 kinase [Pasteurella skyensis]MDP8182615.1 kinase [Pasteurella skyensis]
MNTFEQQVKAVLETNKGRRITSFEFEGDTYWLKQTEKLQGVEYFLKPFPKKALQREIEQLTYLNKNHISTAKLVETGDDYFVTNDVGRSLSSLLNDKNIAIEKTQFLVKLAACELHKLHQQGFVHGRPAIRDITLLEDKIYFIDFENKLSNKNLEYRKVRDLLIFIHSLYRAKLSQQTVEKAVESYIQAGGNEIWTATIDYIKNKRWLYWLLFPFKPIARTDLIAAFCIFEYILNIK